MTTQHEHALANPYASGPPPHIETVATVTGVPQIHEQAEAMTILVTLPPSSPGAPPHRHSGPAYGYVVKGEIIFELEGEPQRVVKAGEAFWEPGG
ncbi:MAG TPA: cupin domain-containing protein, partial [Pseudonocardiaceae bacterium]